MVFLRAWSDDDTGEVVQIGTDSIDGVKTPVLIRVRPLNDDEALAIENKYGREERVETANSVMRAKVPDSDQLVQMLAEKVCSAWLDTQNFWVGIEDDKAAQEWSGVLKKKVAAGDRFCLDGILSDTIKKKIVAAHSDLGRLILRKAKEVGEKRSGVAEALRGNSPAG
jgi:hypothetical protein